MSVQIIRQVVSKSSTWWFGCREQDTSRCFLLEAFWMLLRGDQGKTQNTPEGLYTILDLICFGNASSHPWEELEDAAGERAIWVFYCGSAGTVVNNHRGGSLIWAY